MLNELYTQCHLTKRDDKGHTEQVVWIPAEFAVKNKRLKLKEKDDWVGGWIVKTVHCTVSWHVLNQARKAHKVFEGVL